LDSNSWVRNNIFAQIEGKKMKKSIISSLILFWAVSLYGAPSDDGFAKFNNNDMAGARDSWQKQCDAGDGQSCSYLGFLYEKFMGKDADVSKSEALYKKACDLNVSEGCYNLALLYNEGPAIKRERKKSAELYEKACTLGFARGCFEAGKIYANGHDGVPQDLNKSKALFTKSCEMGNKLGCEGKETVERRR